MVQNSFYFLVLRRKKLLKVSKLLMGQCLKICKGTFFQKVADSLAISSLTFAILMLDQFLST